MKTLTSLAFAAALATSGVSAFAQQVTDKNEPVGPVATTDTGPVAMTDTELDKVAAGQVTIGGGLINVGVDVQDVNVGVNAAAAANVLTNKSNAGAVSFQQQR